MFNVKVTGVNTLNRPGKTRRTRFGTGKRADTKRAIVSLAEGQRTSSSEPKENGKATGIVLERGDNLTWLSLRNVDTVHLLAVDQLNTYDVLLSDDVVFTKAAYDAFVAGRGHGQVGQGRRHVDRGSRQRRGGGQVSNFHKDHRDVLIAPVVSEKSYGLLDANKYTFLVRPGRQQDRDQDRGREGVQRQGDRRQHDQPPGQDPSHPLRDRASARHQARDRQPRRGPAHRHLRRSGLLTGHRIQIED